MVEGCMDVCTDGQVRWLCWRPGLIFMAALCALFTVLFVRVIHKRNTEENRANNLSSASFQSRDKYKSQISCYTE